MTAEHNIIRGPLMMTKVHKEKFASCKCGKPCERFPLRDNCETHIVCIRGLKYANMTLPSIRGLHDYGKTCGDLTCICWFNHANTIRPQKRGPYDYEKGFPWLDLHLEGQTSKYDSTLEQRTTWSWKTLRDLSCLWWLNDANMTLP